MQGPARQSASEICGIAGPHGGNPCHYERDHSEPCVWARERLCSNCGYFFIRQPLTPCKCGSMVEEGS